VKETDMSVSSTWIDAFVHALQQTSHEHAKDLADPQKGCHSDGLQYNEFGPQRNAILFLPGSDAVDVPVGFYSNQYQ
jgi:hypothetical protein